MTTLFFNSTAAAELSVAEASIQPFCMIDLLTILNELDAMGAGKIDESGSLHLSAGLLPRVL